MLNNSIHLVMQLRVWADYYPLKKEPFDIKLPKLLHDVNRIIN